MAKYQVTGVVIKIRDKDNLRLTLKPGQIIDEADLLPAAFEDAVEQGWLKCVEPETTEEKDSDDLGRPELPGVDYPLAEAYHSLDGDEPKAEVATKTHEDLDGDALEALDTDSLLVMVGERIENDDARDAVQTALRGMDDPKGSAMEFLLSSFSDRNEFCTVAVEQAAEAAALEAEAAEIAQAAPEQPAPPADMTGRAPAEE